MNLRTSLQFLAFIFCTMLGFDAVADLNWSGEDLHRVWGYTNSNPNSSLGTDHFVEVADKSRFTDNLSLKAEACAYLGTYRGDQLEPHDYGTTQSQFSEIWPGDFYLEAVGGPALFKLGYQRISWQEGFGLSYTNFINPRDNRASVFDNNDLTFRTSPMANLILSLQNLSLQMFYLPWSQYNISPPFSRFGGGTIPYTSSSQKVNVLTPPQNELADEWGSRLTWGGHGFDVSVFYSRLRDRQEVYQISPTSGLNLTQLAPVHDYITPFGLTTSVEIKDYILRAEYVQIPSRQYNALTGFLLSIYQTPEQALSLILDTPMMSNWVFSFQFSESALQNSVAGSVRPQFENLYLASANYQFGHDKTLKLMAVDISDGSFMGQVSYSAPVTEDLEARFGFESNSGSAGSLGAARADLSRVYTELDHHF